MNQLPQATAWLSTLAVNPHHHLRPDRLHVADSGYCGVDTDGACAVRSHVFLVACRGIPITGQPLPRVFLLSLGRGRRSVVDDDHANLRAVGGAAGAR